MQQDTHEHKNNIDTNNSEDFTRADDTVGSGEVHESSADSGKLVRFVRELVGMKAVLLPVAKGQKRPTLPDWQNVTIDWMDDAGYLAQLESGNIGVLLGSPSNSLCAIDIDDDTAVEPFLALNPALRNTLRTKGARGAQIWIRVTDEYPKLTKLKTKAGAEWGEWRADGGQSVIYGTHPSGIDTRCCTVQSRCR
jgi:hypothetical protein